MPRITPTQIAKALPAVTVVVGIAIAAGGYFGLIRPTLGRLIVGGELDTATLIARRDQSSAYLTRLNAVTDEVSQVNPARVDAVRNTVPTSVDTPGLYVTMDEIARAHGMTMRSIDVTPDEKAVTAAGRRPININVSIEGATYQQFKLFLTDLERSERLLDLTSVVFTPGSAQYGLTLRGYWVDAKPAGTPAVAAAPSAETGP